MPTKLKNNLLKIVLVTIGITAAMLVALSYFHDDDYLHLDFLDVGQGDSILITTPDNFQILVDGGPDSLVLERLREVMPIGDHSIDWLISSHADADHLAGLVDVIENYKIDHIIMPDFYHQTLLYEGWMDAIADEGASVTRISDVQNIELSDGIVIEVLHPSKETKLPKMDVNSASLVFKLSYGKLSFLFAGDIEAEVEEKLVEVYGDQLASTLLKSPHHGSKSSSTPEFLDAIDADYVVIQVGEDNKFGHPHDRVIYRYESREVEYWRTDGDGTVRLLSDGAAIWELGQTPQTLYNTNNNY